MIDVTDRAGQAYDDVTVGWLAFEETGPESGEGEPPQPPEEPDSLSEHPIAKAYRSLFWSFDVDPTKRRPAGEALARRAREGSLPEIHPLVDAYNTASADTLVALSAFDVHRLEGPLVLDEPDEGDQLDAIGEAEPIAPTGNHPLWRDEAGPVGLACYRDGQRTAIRASTSRALVVTLVPDAVPGRVADRAFSRLEARAERAGWEPVADRGSVRL